MEFSLTEQRPTRVRWHILAILSLIMVVTAFGRLNLGIAGKSIQEEFHLSSQAMGWIFGAFAFGYALFQVPSGWAADRFGPRKTLTLAILWWATLTMVMNLVPYFALRLSLSLAWTFGVVRFLTGLGEAASYPNANRMVAFWTAKQERAIGSSLLLGGVGAGGVMAPALFAISMQRWGWQSSFIYLTRVRGLTVAKGGFWGTTPFIAMTLMSPIGGWLSDRAVEHVGTRRGRQSTVWIGMTLSALLLWLGSRTVNNAGAILLLAGAAGFSNFAAPSWWAACIDLAPNHSGSLSALMNTCANSAGGIAPVLTAYIATKFGWTRALDFAALMSFTAGLVWIFVDASNSVEKPAKDYAATQPFFICDAIKEQRL